METILKEALKYLTSNTALSGILVAIGVYLYKKAYERYQNHKAAQNLNPYFSYQNVKEKRELFIESKGQNISPTKEDEIKSANKFVVKQKLISFFLKTAFNEKKESDKFYIVLAGSGMGKTTFMVNLYIQYHSFFNVYRDRSIKMKLLNFRFHGNKTIEKIKQIKEEEAQNTILLLDAFDEYPKILPPDEPDGLTDDERFRRVLDELIETVKHFREIVITSRTQYFPSQKDKPYELNIPKPDHEGHHTLSKIYLSPFDNREIQAYLNKKYGVFRFWNNAKKRAAKEIVQNSPKLMVRPMLLGYIDYLMEGKKQYANTYEIYDTLINRWIEREGNKREHQSINREKLKQNLHKYSQSIAVKIYEHRKENKAWQLSRAEATDINTELKDYQMTGQSLLTRDAENNWKFAHKSILEFFLAKEASENMDFATKLDVSGLDMTEQFCGEIGLKAVLGIGANYVLIKGGEFLMGSPEDEGGRRENEIQHIVKLTDFYMCKYAVTLSDFKRFTEETNHKESDWKKGVFRKTRPESEYNHPVLHVSWNDALAYCDWLSEKTGKTFRLPTEAEWEYACRAGSSTSFHTGKNLTTEQANYDGNHPYGKNKKGIYRGNTVAVNEFDSNAWGLFNMHGNVLEWCGDCYSKAYYEECKKQGVVENPQGASAGKYCVVRGGGWSNFAKDCRLANRIFNSPFNRNSNLGFRLVFVP